MIRSIATRLKQYDPLEARSIVRLLLQDVFGMTLTDICCGAINSLSDNDKALLERLVLRLEQGEPVQYVIGHTEFYGNIFNVRKGCLIPRPETEKLCQWIINETDNKPKILDIGTGSGCIAITLQKNITASSVTAWDICDDALAIAKENATNNEADVRFVQQDALDPPADQNIWDVIVSNPPYICRKEAVDMESNVLDYEPDNALFVPDNKPLLFYDSIITYGAKALKPHGRLYFEINPLYIEEMKEAFSIHSYKNIRVKNDFEGKARMMCAEKC